MKGLVGFLFLTLAALAWGSQARAMSLEPIIAAEHQLQVSDRWGGGHRMIFEFKGRKAWVVEPLAGVAEGSERPWVWTMQWMGSFVKRTGAWALVENHGYCHVHLEAFDTRANDEGLQALAEFHDYLVAKLGFARKAKLIGMSWGGFYSVRYAHQFPDRVQRIYLDAPLLNFDLFEDARPGRIDLWEALRPQGCWSDDPRMPVNMAAAVARAGIPVFLLYGGEDQTVNPKLNCELFASRFKAAGGKLEVEQRRFFGHHPHGLELDETQRLVDFFEGL